MLRWRGLCRAHGIGGRETIDQTGFQLGMGFPVGLGGFARIGGVLVMRRRIEFFSHGDASIAGITPRNPRGSIYRLGQSDIGSVSGTGKRSSASRENID